MKVQLTLTPDHIKLIKNLRFRRFNDAQYGVDSYQLFDGMFVKEEIAWIIGVHDKIRPETADSAFGPLFEENVQIRIDSLSDDLAEHLVDYEDILHQFADQGGLRPGVYKCDAAKRIWEFVCSGDA